MRLFLASSDLSLPPRGPALAGALAGLVGAGSRIAVVLNALDDEPNLERESRLEHERMSLAPVGTDAFELDLREFHGQPAELSAALVGVGLVWAAGGNALLLRAAMVHSGLDALLADRLGEDSIAYGGYSAGACVAGPPLRPADLFGDGHAGRDPVWGGLGLVDFSIVPHYRSGGGEGAVMEQIAAHLEQTGLPHRVLRDGQAIAVADASVTLHQ